MGAGHREKTKLSEFTLWLDAECLEPKWRLEAYSKILELRLSSRNTGYSLEERILAKPLQNYEYLVVECFSKLMDCFEEKDYIFKMPESGKQITQAGLSSGDSEARANAENASEKLLRMGRFEYIDVK